MPSPELEELTQPHPLQKVAPHARPAWTRRGPIGACGQDTALRSLERIPGDHPASPVVTRVTRADGISLRGRMKSTLPVWIAELGMPKNSLVASSWAMTVPPI